MKKAVFFSFMIVLLTTACSNSIEYDTLSARWPVFGEVYALKDASPDSAMKVFQSVADTLNESRLGDLSPFLFNEYQVLKTELKYKNYSPVGNDSLVEHAFLFYESVLDNTRQGPHDKFLLYQFARSLYYRAVVESQRGQTMGSYSDFMRSLGVMDELTGKRRVFSGFVQNLDYEHFTALIYTRLASFLYRYDAWDVALEVLERANESFKIENNSVGIADNMEMMGDIMLAQSDRPTALRFYKASDSIRGPLNDNNIYQHYSTLIHKSISLFDKGENDSVYQMLHHALNRTDNAYLNRRISYSLGYFYYEEQMLDSALANYEKGFPLLPRQTTKALCRIVQISNELGDIDKAALYGKRLADFELEKHALSGERTKMITLYEQYKSDKRDAKNKDLIFFILILVVLLVLMLVIDSFWLERRRRKHNEDKERHRHIKRILEGQIEQTLADSRQKEEKINQLEAELERAVANPDFQKLPFSKKMEVLKQMPICKRALKVVDSYVKAGVAYPELELSENQQGQLINAVDAVFPKFSVRMIEQFPRLKRSDIMYCCLYILGINEIQAAALTGKTYQAVWKRSSKLHEIFGNKSDPQFVLNNILKDW